MCRTHLALLVLACLGGCGPSQGSHEVPIRSTTTVPANDDARPPLTQPPKAIATH